MRIDVGMKQQLLDLYFGCTFKFQINVNFLFTFFFVLHFVHIFCVLLFFFFDQVHIDVGMKQQLLDLLLCYNTLWLRLALETVFGDILILNSNADLVNLTRYIVYRLFSNPELHRR